METIHPMYTTENKILEIVNGFRDRSLAKDQWTHESHLVTSIWFFSQFTEFEAICFLRSGIITYNHQKGGNNTPHDGYHETMTLFWCRVIHGFVSDHKNVSLADLCKRFLGSEMASREFPFKYYSREVLLSVKARAVWVEPDLRILN